VAAWAKCGGHTTPRLSSKKLSPPWMACAPASVSGPSGLRSEKRELSHDHRPHHHVQAIPCSIGGCRGHRGDTRPAVRRCRGLSPVCRPRQRRPQPRRLRARLRLRQRLTPHRPPGPRRLRMPRGRSVQSNRRPNTAPTEARLAATSPAPHRLLHRRRKRPRRRNAHTSPCQAAPPVAGPGREADRHLVRGWPRRG
jgi:hypothetical protein